MDRAQHQRAHLREPVAVELTSDQPIVAGTRVVVPLDEDRQEMAYAGVVEPLAGTATATDVRTGDGETSTMLLTADPEALADLRARVLAPLAELAPGTRDRLAETLLSWLLHQGRRDEVAAELHIHAQTVRYRMGQVRELYGDRLGDPAVVRELVIALSASSSTQT